jgi:putative ABC transport system permease protein
MFADLRYAFRILCKSPAFTAVAVIALALGIGANTAIFSVVNSVLIHPLPYRDPDHLVRLFETEPQLPLAPLCGADFLDWREQNHSFT